MSDKKLQSVKLENDLVRTTKSLNGKKERTIEEKKEVRKRMKKGVGRLPKYNERTVTYAFRCPESKLEYMKTLIKSNLKEWQINN